MRTVVLDVTIIDIFTSMGTALDNPDNIADLLQAHARVLGPSPMIVEPDRTLSWAAVDVRTDRLAAHLVGRGLERGDRVAICTRNVAAHLEAYLACCKAALVPFNVNFRYGVDELVYLLDNADARAVVGADEFVPALEAAAHRYESDAPAGRAPVRVVRVRVADGSQATDSTAPRGWVDYESIVAGAALGAPFTTSWGRSPDDLVFQFTGGTTGMPKAVMWRQADLIASLLGSTGPVEVGASGGQQRRSLTAAPLIHGTGLLSQLANLFVGGTSVLLGGGRFDPHGVWRGVAEHRADVLVIVGDPFGRPLADALGDVLGDGLDLSSLGMITSSGAMLSAHVKQRLFDHLPDVVIFDVFGSSEASGLGVAICRGDDVDATANFRAGPGIRVLGDDGSLVALGSAGRGRVALAGSLPLGYHKDPAKTAAAYPVIDGVRYGVPGDYVEVAIDGAMILLGRGSSVINTGGEKVYAEEVEELLKTYPGVLDAACVPVPDPRFGEAVCAVVALRPGAEPGVDDLRDHVRARAAGYKVPRHVVVVDHIARQPNGKLDRTAVVDLACTVVADQRAGAAR